MGMDWEQKCTELWEKVRIRGRNVAKKRNRLQCRMKKMKTRGSKINMKGKEKKDQEALLITRCN